MSRYIVETATPADDEGLKKIFGHIEVLVLNNEEALKLTGSVDVHRNLRKLSEFAEFAAITEGRHGAHATNGKSIYFMKPFEVPVEDVTGSGDAFGSAFTAAIIKSLGAEQALVWGTANASSEVMRIGTKNDLLSQSGIKKFVKKYSDRNSKVEKVEF